MMAGGGGSGSATDAGGGSRLDKLGSDNKLVSSLDDLPVDLALVNELNNCEAGKSAADAASVQVHKSRAIPSGHWVHAKPEGLKKPFMIAVSRF